VLHFCDIAPELFPEIPRETLDPLVSLLRDDENLPDESREDVFSYVDCLLEVAIRRQIALGPHARVSRAELARIAGQIESLPDAYRRAASTCDF